MMRSAVRSSFVLAWMAACVASLLVLAPAAQAGKPAKVPAVSPAVSGAEPSAEAIVDRALARGAVGFKQGAASIKMTIVSQKGDARERSLDIRAMRGADGMLKSMVKFTRPAEVNGTAYLVLEKKDALPDQYVFVPKARVVRRIAAGNATSTFFGSDFTYADLMPLPVSQRDKVQIAKLPDADIDGQPVHVIDVQPKIDGSPYGRLVAHVHKELLVPLKIDFFDPQGAPLKTLSVRKLQKVNGELVPVEVEMKAAAGSRTQLVLEKVDPDLRLTEADFTEEAMQR